MTTKKTICAGVAAILVWGMHPLTPAMAQDAPSLQSPRSPMEIIRMFDANGDKRIDRGELRYRSIAVFDEVDKNKDGALEPSELPGLSQKSFSAADKDGNGKLSTFEYSQAEFLRFGGMDTNKDGFVTSEEIANLQKREKSE